MPVNTTSNAMRRVFVHCGVTAPVLNQDVPSRVLIDSGRARPVSQNRSLHLVADTTGSAVSGFASVPSLGINQAAVHTQVFERMGTQP